MLLYAETFSFLRSRCDLLSTLLRDEGREGQLLSLVILSGLPLPLLLVLLANNSPLTYLSFFLDALDSVVPGPLEDNDDNAPPLLPTSRLLLCLYRFCGPFTDQEVVPAFTDSSSCIVDTPINGDNDAIKSEGMVDIRFLLTFVVVLQLHSKDDAREELPVPVVLPLTAVPCYPP